jgi:hypothetical protein
MKSIVLKSRDALSCCSLAGHYQKRNPLYSYRKTRRCYVTIRPATSWLDVLSLTSLCYLPAYGQNRPCRMDHRHSQLPINRRGVLLPQEISSDPANKHDSPEDTHARVLMSGTCAIDC